MTAENRDRWRKYDARSGICSSYQHGQAVAFSRKLTSNKNQQRERTPRHGDRAG
jgi:hypothetical protein